MPAWDSAWRTETDLHEGDAGMEEKFVGVRVYFVCCVNAGMKSVEVVFGVNVCICV